MYVYHTVPHMKMAEEAGIKYIKVSLHLVVRDWSLMTGKGGGATKWENCGSILFGPPTLDAPPPLFFKR